MAEEIESRPIPAALAATQPEKRVEHYELFVEEHLNPRTGKEERYSRCACGVTDCIAATREGEPMTRLHEIPFRALEAVQREIERLRAERPGLALQIKRFDAMLYRAEQAEARLREVVQWLGVVLDQIDYTAGACAPTEMVGAVLPEDCIRRARAALAAAQPEEKRHV